MLSGRFKSMADESRSATSTGAVFWIRQRACSESASCACAYTHAKKSPTNIPTILRIIFMATDYTTNRTLNKSPSVL